MNPVTKLWEFYHLRSATDREAVPEHQDDGAIEVTGETGLVFVLIPGGTFWMGAQKDDPGKPNYDAQAESSESPVHRVVVHPFLLSRYEMTKGQWMRLTRSRIAGHYAIGESDFLGGQITAAHPVEQVDWYACNEMLVRSGLELPTEAQWEYGCRAGTGTPWSTGERRESLIGAVNLADQSASKVASWPSIDDWPELEDGFVVPAPVNKLRPNAWGLHHMHGNIAEWCRDAWGTYDKAVRSGDGFRQVVADRSSFRVARGGSFLHEVRRVRSAYRNAGAPAIRAADLGLRPVRAVLP
jgi:formylglycine-generating enzyme required for sulfatase activity